MDSNTKDVFNFDYCGDFYEVVLKGTIITRISKYSDGTSRRVDLNYEDLAEPAKKLVLDKCVEIIRRNR